MTDVRFTDKPFPRVMMPALSALAAAVVVVAGLIWAFAEPPQARVVCHDPDLGHLSADMDPSNAVETPDGWVLYLPNDRIGPRVQVWAECEVGVQQTQDGKRE